jgi:hypothetical protein
LGKSDQLYQNDEKLKNCIIFIICNFAEKLKIINSWTNKLYIHHFNFQQNYKLNKKLYNSRVFHLFDTIDRIDSKRNNAAIYNMIVNLNPKLKYMKE